MVLCDCARWRGGGRHGHARFRALALAPDSGSFGRGKARAGGSREDGASQLAATPPMSTGQDRRIGTGGPVLDGASYYVGDGPAKVSGEDFSETMSAPAARPGPRASALCP